MMIVTMMKKIRKILILSHIKHVLSQILGLKSTQQIISIIQIYIYSSIIYGYKEVRC